MVGHDVIKCTRDRSVVPGDTLIGDGSKNVRYQEGVKVIPSTGKAGSSAFKASDQSSDKLTPIVSTSSLWVKPYRIHQDIARGETHTSGETHLANSCLRAQSWPGCKLLGLLALFPSSSFIQRIFPSDREEGKWVKTSDR